MEETHEKELEPWKSTSLLQPISANYSMRIFAYTSTNVSHTLAWYWDKKNFPMPTKALHLIPSAHPRPRALRPINNTRLRMEVPVVKLILKSWRRRKKLTPSGLRSYTNDHLSHLSMNEGEVISPEVELALLTQLARVWISMVPKLFCWNFEPRALRKLLC